jgi:hypothetical protein
MKLPTVPTQSKNRIETQIAKAELNYLRDDESKFGDDLKGHDNTDERRENRACLYLVTVFGAILDEIWRTSDMSSTEIRTEMHALKLDLESEVFQSKWPASSSGIELSRTEYFADHVRWWFEEGTNSWERFQAYLLELAEWEASDEHFHDSPPPRVLALSGLGTSIPTNTASRIDKFLAKCSTIATRKITKTDFWSYAGYSDATEFQRFQREATNSTAAARINFERILDMSPGDFVGNLNRKSLTLV